MKIAAKVFLILSIVAGSSMLGICLVLGLVFFFAGMAGGGWGAIAGFTGMIVTFIYGAMVLPSFIISIIGLRKLNAAKKADDISVAWKIVILLFSNIVSGIILLCMSDEDYIDKNDREYVESNANNNSEIQTNTNQSRMTNLELLIKYKELLDMGAITQEEYDKKKRELLGD